MLDMCLQRDIKDNFGNLSNKITDETENSHGAGRKTTD
jgi:hypothetical protein